MGFFYYVATMSNKSILAFEEYLRAERRASEKTVMAYHKELERWGKLFYYQNLKLYHQKPQGIMQNASWYGEKARH